MSEPLTFRPENALEDALLAAHENDDIARLLSTLAVGDVFIPSAEPGPVEETRVTLSERRGRRPAGLLPRLRKS